MFIVFVAHAPNLIVFCVVVARVTNCVVFNAHASNFIVFMVVVARAPIFIVCNARAHNFLVLNGSLPVLEIKLWSVPLLKTYVFSMLSLPVVVLISMVSQFLCPCSNVSCCQCFHSPCFNLYSFRWFRWSYDKFCVFIVLQCFQCSPPLLKMWKCSWFSLPVLTSFLFYISMS